MWIWRRTSWNGNVDREVWNRMVEFSMEPRGTWMKMRRNPRKRKTSSWGFPLKSLGLMMGASSMTVQDHASWDAVFAITLFHLFCVSDELLESVIPRNTKNRFQTCFFVIPIGISLSPNMFFGGWNRLTNWSKIKVLSAWVSSVGHWGARDSRSLCPVCPIQILYSMVGDLIQASAA